MCSGYRSVSIGPCSYGKQDQPNKQTSVGIIFTSQLLADLSFLIDMRILLAGILGGIVMVVWTSIAHMGLPLGEAGTNEIPSESVVLSAMQSSKGEKTGLNIFPGLGVGKNATCEEKNEAIKQMRRAGAAKA